MKETNEIQCFAGSVSGMSVMRKYDSSDGLNLEEPSWRCLFQRKMTFEQKWSSTNKVE